MHVSPSWFIQTIVNKSAADSIEPEKGGLWARLGFGAKRPPINADHLAFSADYSE
jgi:hypothetical protein